MGFGRTATESYCDWTSKQALEQLKAWVGLNDFIKAQEKLSVEFAQLDYLGSITPLTAKQCRAKYLGEK